MDFNEIVKAYHPYALESFCYVNETTELLLPLLGDFMLDSGAFTFMKGVTDTVNWTDYIEKYAAFVNKNNIEKFFELDIDSVIGYPKVLDLRHRLEDLTGKAPIPVWHLSRGAEEFKKMCEEYKYVALGGLVGARRGTELDKKLRSAFPWFIETAHKHGAKIHGLGFTSLGLLPEYKFDSVDSTSWTAGNRFGFVYQFTGTTIRKVDCPNGKRLKDPRRVAMINYTEWVKFQQWAETNL